MGRGTSPRTLSPKLKAFVLHLAVSAVAAGALLLPFVWLWYPMPYFVADGGWQGLRLVLAVNLVLGPLLTLVVYNPRKTRRALLFDYAVIALLQAGSLGFGLWTAYAERTVLVAFADGSFYTVDAKTAAWTGARAEAIVAASPERPAYACVRLPANFNARQRLRVESLKTGRALFTRGDLLDPLDAKSFAAVRERAPEVLRNIEANPGDRRTLERFLERTKASASAYVFAPVMCRYGRLVLVFDRASLALVTWLPINLK